jgi:predicted RNase H-like HicB family nuclease
VVLVKGTPAASCRPPHERAAVHRVNHLMTHERFSERKDRGEHSAASWPPEGAIVRGYVAVFEGSGDDGSSAYSPDLPGVVAAGSTRQETEQLMIEAMAEHIALLRESGEPVPEPSDSDSVTVLDPSAA